MCPMAVPVPDRGREARQLSWIDVALSGAEDRSARSISSAIEFLSEWRVTCPDSLIDTVDWSGFDLACREHNGPWAQRWLQVYANSIA